MKKCIPIVHIVLKLMTNKQGLAYNLSILNSVRLMVI